MNTANENTETNSSTIEPDTAEIAEPGSTTEHSAPTPQRPGRGRRAGKAVVKVALGLLGSFLGRLATTAVEDELGI